MIVHPQPRTCINGVYDWLEMPPNYSFLQVLLRYTPNRGGATGGGAYFCFASLLRGQSCTLVIIPLPHYDNLANIFSGQKKTMCRSPPPPPPHPLSDFFKAGQQGILPPQNKHPGAALDVISMHFYIKDRKSRMVSSI